MGRNCKILKEKVGDYTALPNLACHVNPVDATMAIGYCDLIMMQALSFYTLVTTMPALRKRRKMYQSSAMLFVTFPLTACFLIKRGEHCGITSFEGGEIMLFSGPPPTEWRKIQ